MDFLELDLKSTCARNVNFLRRQTLILNWRDRSPIPCFIIDPVGDLGEAYAVPRQQISFSGFQSPVSKVGIAISLPAVRSARGAARLGVHPCS